MFGLRTRSGAASGERPDLTAAPRENKKASQRERRVHGCETQFEDAMTQTRKLTPAEGPLLADHLIRLSPDDRRLRFGGMFLRDESVRRYVASIDWSRSWHVGFFTVGGLRAVVQLSVPNADATGDAVMPWLRKGAAEFAVSVEK